MQSHIIRNGVKYSKWAVPSKQTIHIPSYSFHCYVLDHDFFEYARCQRWKFFPAKVQAAVPTEHYFSQCCVEVHSVNITNSNDLYNVVGIE
jgi:hypothetical protein